MFITSLDTLSKSTLILYPFFFKLLSLILLCLLHLVNLCKESTKKCYIKSEAKVKIYWDIFMREASCSACQARTRRRVRGRGARSRAP